MPRGLEKHARDRAAWCAGLCGGAGADASARRPRDAPSDIIFLSSPDVAVSIANEWYAVSGEAAGAMAGAQMVVG